MPEMPWCLIPPRLAPSPLRKDKMDRTLCTRDFIRFKPRISIVAHQPGLFDKGRAPRYIALLQHVP